MADPDELSRLSCSRCKERKVKCNRILPRCGRCETHGVECFYPQRVKRRPLRRPDDHGFGSLLGSDTALATILERLQRVEDKCTTLPSKQSPRHSSAISSVENPSFAASSAQHAPASPLSCTTPSGLTRSESPWISHTPSSHGFVDASAILKSSIDEVQRQILRQVARSVIYDAVHIPKELAKTWVKAFFEFKRTDMFVSLIDKNLIELMPDLVGMGEVQVDAAIVLIYYTVLYHGCGITASTRNPDHIQYCKSAYICCLRTLPLWQREATGTTTDLVAALSMVLVCADSFDFDLGWQMYKYVCEYVHGLDLHYLDADSSSSNEQRKISDEDRKGFWELIQLDLMFQLMFDKPPSITAKSWKVNMPWLKSGPEPEDSGIATTLFLAGSRIAFILMRFFSMLEGAKDLSREEIFRQTEGMCQEVLDMYNEGRLGQRMLDSTTNDADAWRVIDITMSGYICIVLMMRKIIMLGSDTPSNLSVDQELSTIPMALDAARNIIENAGRLLNRYPWPASLAALFGAYQIHLSYGMIVQAALHGTDIHSHAADVQLIRMVSGITSRIASKEKEYMPLVRAMQTLDAELRQRGL